MQKAVTLTSVVCDGSFKSARTSDAMSPPPSRVAGLGGLIECKNCGSIGATSTTIRHSELRLAVHSDHVLSSQSPPVSSVEPGIRKLRIDALPSTLAKIKLSAFVTSFGEGQV